VGQTSYGDPLENKEPYWSLDFEAASLALEDAGLNKGDIDAVVTAGYDLYDGMVITAQFSHGAACSWWKDGCNVAEDGMFAVASAFMKIKSGLYDTVMVVSHGAVHAPEIAMKASSIAFDPFFFRPVGSISNVLDALQSSRYLHLYGVKEEQAAWVAVRAHENGLKNKKAHIKKKVELEEVMSSPFLCWPVKQLEYCQGSCGASALVLTTGELASWRARSKPVAWINGVGWASETYQVGGTELGRIGSTARAAREAYKMAGIRDPRKEVDVAEVGGITPYHEMMIMEGLGFCDFGKGSDFLKEGLTALGGKIHIDPSGGLICTNPLGGAGMFSMAEAALQIMGRAGDHQVPEAKIALAHGMSNLCGPAGRGSCVAVLGAE
jgi:acetyl-CoA C-acetyltransferase